LACAKLIRLIFLRPAGYRAVTVSRAIIGPEVGVHRTLRTLADAVAPVVAVGEAAARPAHDRRLDPAHVLDQRRAESADVRYLRVFTYPDAVVNHAAQMFGEVPVQIG